jgi:hypothetical protein
MWKIVVKLKFLCELIKKKNIEKLFWAFYAFLCSTGGLGGVVSFLGKFEARRGEQSKWNLKYIYLKCENG